jgi:hypothetical protein
MYSGIEQKNSPKGDGHQNLRGVLANAVVFCDSITYFSTRKTSKGIIPRKTASGNPPLSILGCVAVIFLGHFLSGTKQSRDDLCLLHACILQLMIK